MFYFCSLQQTIPKKGVKFYQVIELSCTMAKEFKQILLRNFSEKCTYTALLCII